MKLEITKNFTKVSTNIRRYIQNGNALMVFIELDYISQIPNFSGSTTINYLSNCLNINKRTVVNALDHLQEIGIINYKAVKNVGIMFSFNEPLKFKIHNMQSTELKKLILNSEKINVTEESLNDNTNNNIPTSNTFIDNTDYSYLPF